jgi:tol-pal system protein YbgF
MTSLSARAFRGALLAAPAIILVSVASAQETAPRPPGFLDNLFGGPSSQQQPEQPGHASAADLAVRLERLENHVRQLTGAIEQLQFRNQQLEQQLQRGPMDAGTTAARSAAPARPSVGTPPMLPPPAPAVATGRRSDVFDPTLNPNAPGAPQTLGAVPVAPDPGTQEVIGAPGGRAAGAPLDLSTLSGDPSLSSGQLPPPPPRNPNATGAQVATLPPSQTPKDEFDLAYGYVQRKDYALAEDGLRAFLRKYPSDQLAAEAQFWLGESLFQRQHYRDSAESFLAVTTRYETNPKAPDALLRLGQSLAALGEKETACAAWGEIGRKYPRASAAVKKTVATEQKRVRC